MRHVVNEYLRSSPCWETGPRFFEAPCTTWMEVYAHKIGDRADGWAMPTPRTRVKTSLGYVTSENEDVFIVVSEAQAERLSLS